MENNRLINISPRTLKPLNNLGRFHLQNNRIADLDSSSFDYMKQLVTLDLSQNHIQEIEKDSFKRLRYIKVRSNVILIFNLIINQIKSYIYDYRENKI